MNLYKIGIDEAGRGPWAGPVFAGLVVLTHEQENLLKEHGITDSKKLTAKKRETLYTIIIENSVFAKVKFLPASSIDEVGIYNATKLLIQELSLELEANTLEGTILIDGQFPGLTLLSPTNKILEHECIIKGDEKEPSISAASILAKVRRDAYMLKLHDRLPQYEFDKHKGYGTKLHMEMLAKHGPSDEHRKSFKPIKKFL